jgi:hypothetical protein
MALNAILDSLDGLSEDLASAYTEKDGRFYLDVTPVDGFSLEDVAGLKSSLAKERTNARSLSKQYEGIDAEAARDALSRFEEIANWTPDEKIAEQMAAREKQLHGKHQGEMARIMGESGDMRAQLEQHLVKSVAMQALQSAGGNADLLMPHIMGQTRMELVDGKFVAQVVDDKGVPRVSMKQGSTDNMGIAELVESMRNAESFSPAFAGSGATGSGSAGSASAGRGGSGMKLSWEDAHDPAKYRAARDAAEKAGRTLQVGEFGE